MSLQKIHKSDDYELCVMCFGWWLLKPAVCLLLFFIIALYVGVISLLIDWKVLPEYVVLFSEYRKHSL